MTAVNLLPRHHQAGLLFTIRILQFAKTNPLGHDPPDRGLLLAM